MALVALSSLVAAVAAAGWILWWRRAFSASKLGSIPYLKFDGDDSEARYTAESRTIISRGYQEYLKRGQPFCMRNPIDSKRPLVILPFKYLDEVRSAPQNKLSLPLQLDKVFSRMSARVLVGPELRDEWQKLSLAYVSAVLKAPSTVRAKYHPSLYWLAKYLNPDVKEVLKFRRQAGQLLQPTIKARLASSPGDEPHEDAIQWLLDGHRAKGRTPTADDIAQNLFVLMTASIHSTSSTALSILFDLMDHPQSLADIRREIAQVRSQNSAGWTRHALSELHTLDAFMRESQRVHSFTQLTVQRIVASPWTFKDGLSLPVGTQLSFASNEHNLDADTHADAATLDAGRFLRRTAAADPSSQHRLHFASTEDTLVWGSGAHACPGRFFAEEALRLIFVRLLTAYDFKHPADGQQRPPDMPRNFNIVPNVMAPLLFREKGI
ncbi:cytochrome P450 [Lasiosphaeria ovina]|uniref:Cytochrome P450 n=1 Tax=Lasiosphaeria ovina TaxID=92902 RepID=A0AAE0NA11_9PEZI|nr:cytochrome P450 [Lasiosphaeria ovina]